MTQRAAFRRRTVPGVLRYAIITPARNERVNLERLAPCVLAQTHLPEAWIVVDDGSDDGTDVLAGELATEHDFVRLLAPEPVTDGALTEGRFEGRDLIAFRRGAAALARPVDVVVKVDADTSFDPAYFETLIGYFEADSKLGIAGGSCYEIEGGEWQRVKVAETHPRGASRAYRWQCLQDSLSLEPKMGWDGLDEVQASMNGFTTKVFLDIGFRHHRPMGGRERGKLRAGSVLGRASWYMGYRPSYLMLRVAYRFRREPQSVAMLWGYAAAAATRTPRCPDRRLITHLREQQRLRGVLVRGANP
jgi:glycosyltransferase involved in cell wall biosynthesis